MIVYRGELRARGATSVDCHVWWAGRRECRDGAGADGGEKDSGADGVGDDVVFRLHGEE